MADIGRYLDRRAKVWLGFQCLEYNTMFYCIWLKNVHSTHRTITGHTWDYSGTPTAIHWFSFKLTFSRSFSYLCFFCDCTLTKPAEFPQPAVCYWYSVNYLDSNYLYEQLFGLTLQLLTFQDRRHHRRSVASSVDTESQKDNYDTDKSDNPDSRSESKRN